LKIWLSFNYFGADAFRAAIDRSIELALMAEQQVRDAPELELLSPASLGIICFRRSFPDVHDEEQIAALNAQLVTAFELTGRGLVSSTRLHGTYAIRLCVMNHTSGPHDVRETLAWFAEAPRPSHVAAQPASRHEDRYADVRGGWADAVDFDETTIRRLPLFAELPADAIELVLRSARDAVFDAGETVIHRWQGTRHFYTIVDGSVEIRGGDELLRELGPGEFFGELAALDWGAGFGYARTATVIAASRVRLLVLPPSALGELIRRAPSVDRIVRAAAGERVQNI
jgi:hypothetical protein